MIAKIGRPTDDPKNLSVRIRLSESDQEQLNYCSAATGKTKAQIIREGIKKVYQEVKRNGSGQSR